MPSSICITVGGVARAAPSRPSASRSASRPSHITSCAEPEQRSSSVAPRATRRAFGAGAALLAAGLESSTEVARAFERPPPGASRERSRDWTRDARANAALSSTSVGTDARALFLFALATRRPGDASLRPRERSATDRPSSRRSVVSNPPGYRPFNDTIDGYKLFRPDNWIEVKGSGNDVFFRNPASAEENLFVSISSPSSTKFESPRDLGSPEDAARKVLEQTLTEFMSTRLGVRRESSVVSATERLGTGADGEPMLFYDCVFRVASYATKNQYGLTEADRPQVLEWDRVLCSTLGVANKRLYELRTQCAAEDYEKSADTRRVVRESFKPFEVDQSNLSFPLF